jgi:hypothetical protein
MQTDKQIIFLSYTSLLIGLIGGIHGQDPIDNDALNSAYFAFGCAREHLLRDIEKFPGEIAYLDEEAKVAHQVILSAVLKAEREGRVCWCKDERLINQEDRIVEFLISKGHSIGEQYSVLKDDKYARVTYQTLVELIKSCDDLYMCGGLDASYHYRRCE